GLGRVQDMEQEATTAQDVVHLTTKATADGAITAQVRDVMLNTLSLGRRTARQIMVPRMRVVYLDMQWSMQKNREVMEAHLYSRLPLCDGGLDKTIGIVGTKEFLTAYDDTDNASIL